MAVDTPIRENLNAWERQNKRVRTPNTFKEPEVLFADFRKVMAEAARYRRIMRGEFDVRNIPSDVTGDASDVPSTVSDRASSTVEV